MTNDKFPSLKSINIDFKSRKDKSAHRAWIKALECLGGAGKMADETGILKTRISLITNGYPNSSTVPHKQCFPTPEQAIIVSLATKGLVMAEHMLPEHDFSYIYKYCKLVNKIVK